jgi:hypothetical protein
MICGGRLRDVLFSKTKYEFAAPAPMTALGSLPKTVLFELSVQALPRECRKSARNGQAP